MWRRFGDLLRGWGRGLGGSLKGVEGVRIWDLVGEQEEGVVRGVLVQEGRGGGVMDRGMDMEVDMVGGGDRFLWGREGAAGFEGEEMSIHAISYCMSMVMKLAGNNI